MRGEINRFVDYIFAQPLVTNGAQPRNNTWVYKRAKEGLLFILHSVQISTTSLGRDGLFAIYDGHEYTQWNQFPGVVSHEVLGRAEFNLYQYTETIMLNNWECKEFTLATRSMSESVSFKACVITWYYLKKATKEEILEYAVLQPKGDLPLNKGGPTTLDRFED